MTTFINKVKTKIKDILEKIKGYKVVKAIDSFLAKGDRKFVLTLYFLAIGVFVSTLFTNELAILISGDFTLQEIPFYFNGYDDWWTYFKTGEFPLWDESGFLGSNNIGSNAFYYLLNIFFLPLVLVPRELVPQGMAFLIITKFVLAGFVMKKLLRYIGVSEKNSKLVAMAYSFSGWALFYLWFNHFLEIAVIYPLVILGIEKVLKEKKVTLLITSLFLMAVTNYFFFIMTCFTTVIYAIYRFCHYAKSYNWKDALLVMGLGVLSYIVAISMAAVVLLPCFSVALESPRADSSDASSFTGKLLEILKSIKLSFETKEYSKIFPKLGDLFELCTKFDEEHNLKVYSYPIVSYFYPPATCYDSILFNNKDYENANSSLFMYSPLMLMLIPSLINSVKQKKASHLFAFGGILVLLFTPFAYYCFSGFTSVCYGRWELFVVVIGCMYIATNMDQLKSMKKWYLDVSIVIVVTIQVLMLILGISVQDMMEELETKPLGDLEYYAIAVIIYTIVSYFIFRKSMHSNKFHSNISFLTMVEILLVGNILVTNQGVNDLSKTYGGYESLSIEQKLINELKEEDSGYYRLYNSSLNWTGVNLAMIEGYRGSATFHSIYNYKSQDFIDWSRTSYNYRGWSMGVHEKRMDLDTLLNMKYYILKSNDINVPLGYKKIKELDGRVVYENTNFVELGFAFDTIVTDLIMSGYDNIDNVSNYTSYNATAIKNDALFVRYAFLDSDIAQNVAKENGLNYKHTVTSTELEQVFIKEHLKSEDILISRAIWDVKEQGKRDGFEEPVSYTKQSATGLLYSSYLDINCKDYGIAEEAKTRGGAYITVKAVLAYNTVIELYGEDENGKEYLLTKDHHVYGLSSHRKAERGFYVNDKVTRIRIIVNDTLTKSEFIYKPDVTYQYYDTYKANIDKLKENPLENIKVGVNDFKFDTEYDSKKIVVLTIPYDDGWSVTSTNSEGIKKEHQVYCAQGGFVSFVADEGEQSYVVKYVTPHIQTGLLFFAAGMFMFGMLYVGYEMCYLEKKNIKKQLAL